MMLFLLLTEEESNDRCVLLLILVPEEAKRSVSVLVNAYVTFCYLRKKLKRLKGTAATLLKGTHLFLLAAYSGNCYVTLRGRKAWRGTDVDENRWWTDDGVD